MKMDTIMNIKIKRLKMFVLAKKLMVMFLLISAFSTSLFAIPKGCEKIMANDNQENLTSKDRVCVAAVLAEELSATTPMTVDPYTTLIGVISIKDTLIYKYSISLPKDLDVKKVAISMDKITTNSNCSTPEVRGLIDLDITLEHSYYDKNGVYKFNIVVDKAKCQKLKIK